MKRKMLELLQEHRLNCGDNRGCDGEYLGDAVGEIIALVKSLLEDKEKLPEHELTAGCNCVNCEAYRSAKS